MRTLTFLALATATACATGLGVNSGLRQRTYRAEESKVWQEVSWLMKFYESEQLAAAGQASMVYRGLRSDRDTGELALDLLQREPAPAQRPQMELTVKVRTAPEGITVTARVLPLDEGKDYRLSDADRMVQQFLDRLDVQMGIPRLVIGP